MARVSKGSDTFFRLSPAEVGKAQCFAVQRGEVNKRALGAQLYSPELRLFLKRLGQHPAASKTLSAYVAINPSIDLSGLNADSPVSFIPMEAVEDGATGKVELQSSRLAEVQKGYTPFAEGDILWAKITPCMQNGKSCIAQGLENGVGFGSTEFHVFRVRDDRTSTEFVWEFLNQETLRHVATYAFTGSAGHQRVPDSFLAELPFPEISPQQQALLVAHIAQARLERRTKLDEAEALLTGLDDFLLNTLSLTLPPNDGRKVFAILNKDAPSRFDPHFYLPALIQNTRMLATAGAEPLGSLVSFSDEVWRPAAHDNPTFRYIEISGVNPQTGEARAETTSVTEAPSRARMALRTNDIIVSLTRPHHGSIAQITPELNGCVASTGFSVLRGIDESRVNREYLWCVLRTKMCLKQMLQRASGGNYPAITEQELAKVLLPVPTLAVQETIAAESRRRREEARRLRAQAETSWKVAKRWFEEQLLGPAQP